MRRFALVGSALLLCTFAVTFITVTATPSWSDLDHRVSVSKQPINFECYTKCDHKGLGGVCISTSFTWTCAINDGYCNTIQQCIQ